MARIANPNRLLVEGAEELRVISHFMDQYVEWGDKPQEWVADVKSFNGVEDLLKPGVIEAESKIPGLKAIGIIVDADDQFDSRWSSIERTLPEDRRRLSGRAAFRRCHPSQ